MNSDVLTPTRPARPGGPQPVPDDRRPVTPRRRPGSAGLPPKAPVRPASPVRPPGPSRPGRPAGTSTGAPAGQRVGAERSSAAGAGHAGQLRRTSFVVLLLGLLGGGLVCLLVVNTTLAANSIKIFNLQKENAASSEQVQELQGQVAVARSAATIAKEAKRLGMRPDPELVFINLRTKKVEAPRGAAAAALAARLAAGWPATSGRSAATSHRKSHGSKSHRKKPTAGRPAQ